MDKQQPTQDETPVFADLTAEQQEILLETMKRSGLDTNLLETADTATPAADAGTESKP